MPKIYVKVYICPRCRPTYVKVYIGLYMPKIYVKVYIIMPKI